MSLGVDNAKYVSGFNNAISNENQVQGLQDQFMKILLTQLRYQDPMEPVNEQDFLAQMAQFTTATQMQKLNDNVSLLCGLFVENQLTQNLYGAVQFIGKRFEAVTETGVITGIVESVGFSSNGLVIYSQGCEISLDNLVSVGGVIDEDNPE